MNDVRRADELWDAAAEAAAAEDKMLQASIRKCLARCLRRTRRRQLRRGKRHL